MNNISLRELNQTLKRLRAKRALIVGKNDENLGSLSDDDYKTAVYIQGGIYTIKAIINAIKKKEKVNLNLLANDSTI